MEELIKNQKSISTPHPYRGWLGLMQTFNPEMDGCEPKRSGWLFLGEVSERVDKLENSLKKDKRLEYDPDCVRKAPYDLIAGSSTHAYIDGIVTATIRTYIVETILRTMPTLASLRFNSQNYDTGMGLFLINRMKEEMKDFPNNRNSGTISKLRYWYLFLEQAVQTVERRIIMGEITKDEELDLLFSQIIEVKAGYYYPTKRDRKILKRVTKVAWNSDGFVDYLVYDYGQGAVTTLREGDPLFSKLSGFIDAVSFNAFGPSFRQVLKNIVDFKFKVRKISLKELRMYTKVYDIYKSEDIAMQISSRLILNEFNAYQHKIQKYLPEKPYVQDLNKFVLNPKSGLTIGPPINVGTVKGEHSDSIEKKFYGDVISVVDDTEAQHPLENLSPFMNQLQKDSLEVFGAFYLEKYVVVSPNVIVMATNENFRNQFQNIQNKPISVEKFEEAFGRFKSSVGDLPGTNNSTGELFISDLFGTATRNDDGESYEGSIGIRFGVRLSYLPPSGFNPTSGEDDNIDLNVTTPLDLLSEPNKKQLYYKTLPEEFDSESFKYPIPLVNFEEDITDVKIKNLQPRKIDNLLKCYIDKLAETPEYKFLMNYVFNVKSFATMSSIYSYYGFPDSVGEDPGERYNASREANKAWIDKIMKKTKLKNYRLFKKYYNSQDFNKEEPSDPKHSDSFAASNKPSLDLNIKDNVRWWQRKRFYERPFNEEGRECTEGALGAFDQNESKPPRTDENDYSSSTLEQEESGGLKNIESTAKEAAKHLQQEFLEENENNAFMMPSYGNEQVVEDYTSSTQTFTATQNVYLGLLPSAEEIDEEVEDLQESDVLEEEDDEGDFQDIGAEEF